MPRRNRVTPFGELVADPARGLVYGNRGCLHDEHGHDQASLRRQAVDRLPARVPRLEARPAAAAGPVHGAVLPRRGDRLRRRPPALRALPQRRLPELRDTLARASPRRRPRGGRDRQRGSTPSASSRARAAQRRHAAPFDTLPDGAFVWHDDAPRLVLGDRLLRWTPAGYEAPVTRPRGEAVVLTPPSLVGVLHAGWRGDVPLLHPTAGARTTG